jgi:hypothetical protein
MGVGEQKIEYQCYVRWGISVYETFFCSFYYYSLFATCFGRTTNFKQKYIHQNLTSALGSRLTDGSAVVSLTRRLPAPYHQKDSWCSFLSEAVI